MTLMDEPPTTRMVSLTIEGTQANLTLTRSDKFNAMNVDMIQELIAVLEWRQSAALDAKMHCMTPTAPPTCARWYCGARGSTSAPGPTST